MTEAAVTEILGDAHRAKSHDAFCSLEPLIELVL